MSGHQPTVGSELQLALIERIDSRLDAVAEDMRDVRERVIRIEAQDVAGKLTIMETRLKTLEEWKARVTGQVALVIVPVAAAVGAAIKLVLDLLFK